MSINAFGVFIMNNKGTWQENIEFSFVIQNIANKYKIGLNQGINVSSRSANFIKKEHGFNVGELSYEITDNPLDCNTEMLFAGYDFDANIKEGDTFECRMEKVKTVFKEIFETGLVTKINLYINIEVGYQYSELNTTINDFVEKVVKVFKEENGWTPSVKITINI